MRLLWGGKRKVQVRTQKLESRKFAKRCVDYMVPIAACMCQPFLDIIMARIYAVCEGWLYG